MIIVKTRLIDISNEFDEEPNFTSRYKARQFGEILHYQYINKLPSLSALEVDFAGIQYFDAAFLDELILSEIQLFIDKEKDNLIYLTNVPFELFEQIKMALLLRKYEKKPLGLLGKRNEAFMPFPPLEESFIPALTELSIYNKTNSRQLSDNDELSLKNAGIILRRLYDRRLVLRKEVPDKYGPYYEYFYPDEKF